MWPTWANLGQLGPTWATFEMRCFPRAKSGFACTAPGAGVRSSYGSHREPPAKIAPQRPSHRKTPPRFRSLVMEQKFDATPKAELRLRGRTVTRGDVANDWGLQLRWVVKRDGKVI